MRHVLSIFFLSLLLSGCAGLSQEECLTADWQIIGFEDGAAGRSASRIGDHRRACAKHGVSPDKTAYDTGYDEGIRQYCSLGRGSNAGAAGYSRLQVCPADSDYQRGYEEGLVSFCTYDSGYSYGLAGGDYGRVCPPTAEANFLDGYVAGKAIYTLQSQLSELQIELNEIVARRDQIEDDQDALKTQIVIDRQLTSEDRARLLLDIDSLRDLDDDLEAQEEALLLRITDVQVQLRDLGVDI